MDEAYKETEKILKNIERRINREYHQAEIELQEKIDDYFRRFKYKDETWQKWVREGSKTQRQYNDWRIGQMAIGRRWEEQKETIARDMAHANEVARKIVSQKMPDVYALNHNYGTYEVEHGSQIDTGYTMYDHDTVEGLFLNRKIYHDPGRTTLNKIAQGLEQRWNRQNVQSAMMQGILQGESIPKMASRLAETVGEKNRKAAIRNARTITTGVQNKGRIDSYDRANKMGIPTSKQWVATLDGRTRHTHREIDGEVVPEGELFSNGCEYPGDPGGAPEEIYNCRCSVIAAIKGFERDLSDLSNRRSEKLGDMTYDEWKNAKAKSQDITHGDKVSKAMKDAYKSGYKGLELSSPVSHTISSRSAAMGKPSAIIGGAQLSKRQDRLLSALRSDGDSLVTRKKDVNMRDLSALSAHEGVEFALLSKGQTRMVIRGSELKVSSVNSTTARQFASDGWKISGHTHVFGGIVPSDGDESMVRAFNQSRSMVCDITGQWGMVYGK